MAEGIIVKETQGLGILPLKSPPTKIRQYRELSLKVDLAAKIKLNILSTLNAAEVQEGLRNGTVVPDWKKQILLLSGNQIGTFTISEARIKDVA